MVPSPLSRVLPDALFQLDIPGVRVMGERRVGERSDDCEPAEHDLLLRLGCNLFHLKHAEEMESVLKKTAAQRGAIVPPRLPSS